MARSEAEMSVIAERFGEAMNAAIAATFGEGGLPDGFSTITGFRFDEQVGCHIMSNLNVCQIPVALDQMLKAAIEDHGAFHAGQAHEVTEVVPPESVPQDIQDEAQRVADRVGAETIVYVETVDTSDLHESDGSEFADDVTPEDGGS